MDPAFSIVSAKRVSDGNWNIAGRAYADLAVGVTLTDAPNGASRWRVVSISSYGRSVEFLSKMMTGTLVLEGDAASALTGDTFLYPLADT
jgi:hypothetical protein